MNYYDIGLVHFIATLILSITSSLFCFFIIRRKCVVQLPQIVYVLIVSAMCHNFCQFLHVVYYLVMWSSDPKANPYNAYYVYQTMFAIHSLAASNKLIVFLLTVDQILSIMKPISYRNRIARQMPKFAAFCAIGVVVISYAAEYPQNFPKSSETSCIVKTCMTRLTSALISTGMHLGLEILDIIGSVGMVYVFHRKSKTLKMSKNKHLITMYKTVLATVIITIISCVVPHIATELWTLVNKSSSFRPARILGPYVMTGNAVNNASLTVLYFVRLRNHTTKVSPSGDTPQITITKPNRQPPVQA